MKKMLLTAVAGLALISAPIVASAQSYGYGHNSGRGVQSHGYSQSRGYGQGYGRGYGRERGGRDNGGALLAAGVFGLVLGAIVSNAANSQHASYAYDNGYNGYNGYGADNGYSYGYGADNGYGYGQQCGWQTQAYRNAWGQVSYQQVQVCR